MEARPPPVVIDCAGAMALEGPVVGPSGRTRPVDYNKALEFTRYNSGEHFLDSGGENGRTWQKPPNKAPLAYFDPDDGAGTINMTRMLEAAELHELHDDLYELMGDGAWFDEAPEAMRQLGYTQLARDNTYNTQNDLDQDFVYEVYDHDDPDIRGSSDWIYSDTAVVILYIHTGADIRGGYSKPCVVDFSGCVDEFVMPLDFIVGYSPNDGEPVERYESGYSNYPLGQIEGDGYEFVRVEDDGDTAVFVKDGEESKFHPWYFEIHN